MIISEKHNKREHNPPTQTHMRVEGTSQHSTQQERTQPTNSNTHACRGDCAAQHTTRENTTYQLKHTCASRGLRSTAHNKREHNPPTQTHMRIEMTHIYIYIYLTTEYSSFLTKDFNT
jgi:hypothetical protein